MSNIFFPDSLILNESSYQLTKAEIEDLIPYDFVGKKDFVEFYLKYNGVIFPNGAFYFRDKFYDVSQNDYNMLDVGAFLSLVGDSNESTIFSLWDSIKNNASVQDFANKHIPFSLDSSGNFFWIEISSGKIFYLPMESPEDVCLVAPTFQDFYSNIQADFKKY